MADPATQTLLRRLVLSADELRLMTDWPGALIEDYLNILDDIIKLANVIDQKGNLVDGEIGDIPVIDIGGELATGNISIDDLKSESFFLAQEF